MEYVYGAMLLHKAGQKVNEDSLKKVLEAAGVKVDASRVKALVAALQNVDIEEAIKSAAVAPTTVASAVTAAPAAEKKEDKPKQEEKNEEMAAAGLGALFG
ncbi:MAG: 50S ribosomal protein P1 [Nanoarchaeota archaeon]|nr:50S ribosomal protein P1 [Nanoarchaeota archaeon]MBU1270372.1 50S ribosomal protein P1 [Nanoarchaeota archaeon]MBU1604643.1 50S ribosomal protein P1 [Nanoarchaeota archaeon]MBU2442644.1 50S ribosomal protein P1 [Nanoarchaeota archaeon]